MEFPTALDSPLMILPKQALCILEVAKLPAMEGATGTFGVRLSKGPPANVAVAVSASGDAKIVEVYGAVSATVSYHHFDVYTCKLGCYSDGRSHCR